jgi:hypothetical protein
LTNQCIHESLGSAQAGADAPSAIDSGLTHWLGASRNGARDRKCNGIQQQPIVTFPLLTSILLASGVTPVQFGLVAPTYLIVELALRLSRVTHEIKRGALLALLEAEARGVGGCRARFMSCSAQLFDDLRRTAGAPPLPSPHRRDGAACAAGVLMDLRSVRRAESRRSCWVEGESRRASVSGFKLQG